MINNVVNISHVMDHFAMTDADLHIVLQDIVVSQEKVVNALSENVVCVIRETNALKILIASQTILIAIIKNVLVNVIIVLTVLQEPNVHREYASVSAISVIWIKVALIVKYACLVTALIGVI
eukprot:GHVR01160945.1.p1 GENE.GHVR01160945.1~~GHVR01160945.1.p1  ORF type:complete len:122 (-),score=0.65 GHVR01160945.1:1897-2262(-)